MQLMCQERNKLLLLLSMHQLLFIDHCLSINNSVHQSLCWPAVSQIVHPLVCTCFTHQSLSGSSVEVSIYVTVCLPGYLFINVLTELHGQDTSFCICAKKSEYYASLRTIYYNFRTYYGIQNLPLAMLPISLHVI